MPKFVDEIFVKPWYQNIIKKLRQYIFSEKLLKKYIFGSVVMSLPDVISLVVFCLIFADLQFNTNEKKIVVNFSIPYMVFY